MSGVLNLSSARKNWMALAGLKSAEYSCFLQPLQLLASGNVNDAGRFPRKTDRNHRNDSYTLERIGYSNQGTELEELFSSLQNCVHSSTLLLMEYFAGAGNHV